jgi:hypothetical protein
VSAYTVALFVHVLGVVTLFVAIGLQQRGWTQVRSAGSLEHLRLWLGLVRSSQNLYGPAIILLLAGGLFMAGKAWSFTTSWIVVALAGLGVMIVAGILVVGRRFAAIESAASAADEGPVPPDVARRIAEPGAWVCMFALNGVAVGILWLMTNKPGWVVSVAVVAGLAAVAGAAGRAVASPKRAGAAAGLAGGRQ